MTYQFCLYQFLYAQFLASNSGFLKHNIHNLRLFSFPMMHFVQLGDLAKHWTFHLPRTRLWWKKMLKKCKCNATTLFAYGRAWPHFFCLIDSKQQTNAGILLSFLVTYYSPTLGQGKPQRKLTFQIYTYVLYLIL